MSLLPVDAPSALSDFDDGERRIAALAAAIESPAPSAEAEEWRYSPIGDLSADAYQPQLVAPTASTAPATVAGSGQAASISIVDGWIVAIDVDPGWEAKGLSISDVASADRTVSVPDAGRFDHLHLAFSPSTLDISVVAGLTVTEPIVITSHLTSGPDAPAAFPHVRVATGADAEVTVVEYQTSDGAGLSVPLVELTAASASRLRHIVVQQLHRDTWQLGRLTSTAADQSTLSSGIAAFGGGYARVRTDTSLDGRGATGNLVAVYYGDENQVHDFRTFQHHRGPGTLSDLLFKGAVDDNAGSIYTGLIEIHEEGAGSNAHQTNRNVKLSEDAWAWSVPNLEIRNNDVRCSHASTVSPVDIDQQFYLQARGVPPTIADRLIVAGFFDEVLQRLGDPAVVSLARDLISAKLDGRAS